MTIPESAIPEFLDDLKSELNITDGQHDAELSRKLKAAYRLAVSVAGFEMYPTTTTELITALPVLKHHPVLSITSATYLSVDYAGVAVISGSGVVSGLYVGTSITYVHGQTEPTDNQREGVLLIASHLWKTQRAPSAGPLGDDEPGFVPGYGFAVPNMARDLLRPPSAGLTVA